MFLCFLRKNFRKHNYRYLVRKKNTVSKIHEYITLCGSGFLHIFSSLKDIAKMCFVDIHIRQASYAGYIFVVFLLATAKFLVVHYSKLTFTFFLEGNTFPYKNIICF
jgi:hypothetical protein